MPRRKSDQKEPTAAIPLRRSPRFLQIVLVDPENPITPDPEPRRRTRIPSSGTPLTLTGKKEVSRSKKCSQKPDKSRNVRQTFDDHSEARLTKSTRLNRCADECNAANSSSTSNRRYRELKNRVRHTCCCKDVDKNADALAFDDDDTNERVLSVTENQIKDKKLSGKNVDKSTNAAVVSTAIVVYEEPIHSSDNNKITKNICVKRTRNQFENTEGWTKDQESALEKAYIEAKPTPHFWKKVSKLVPGKSAQDCFDKIHCSHLTPPQPRTRSRSRVSNPSFSASNLLNFSSPTVKKPKNRKQKSHVIQRTVRYMLQNQYKPEEDTDADLFSILEPTYTRSVNCNLTLTTPDRNPNEGFKKCRERSSTVNSNKKSEYGTTILVSPPVLKQVKNKALHEKYIDQLNCREAKRKAGKLNQNKGVKYETSVERKNAIKDAKNALVFGARDAINEFQYQNGRVLSNLFDDESDSDADKDNGLVFL